MHLALEKILKAHVVWQTGDLAPRVHHLIRLAELGGLSLTAEQRELLADVNSYRLEGRYPSAVFVAPSYTEARDIVKRALEVFEWLSSQL